jgi:hypothetical protein
MRWVKIRFCLQGAEFYCDTLTELFEFGKSMWTAEVNLERNCEKLTCFVLMKYLF